MDSRKLGKPGHERGFFDGRRFTSHFHTLAVKAKAKWEEAAKSFAVSANYKA
jgi:hypothetical protein